jgi:dipeptidyl-peptidase 4
MLRLTCLVLAITPVLAVAQKKPVTMDAVYEDSGRADRRVAMPSAWTPDGKAFVVRRNHILEVFDAASGKTRTLVSTDALEGAAVKAPQKDHPFDWQNRRVHPTEMEFSGSGTHLLYSAGGDIFLIQFNSGSWVQLTKTQAAEEDPKLSPDGSTVAFRRNWDLYALDVSSGKETRLTENGSETLRNGGLDWVYPEELDLGTAYWWSPDSKSIAYLQFDTSREPIYPHEDLLRPSAVYEPQRYPHAGENNADVRLGVVAAKGGPTRWIDTGDTRNNFLIARAGWMPDSKSVYMIRLNRTQNHLEMIAASAATGEQRVVFSESDRFWVNLDGDVIFLNGGKRFLWTSERDGFRHVYLYSNDGRKVKQLTKGSWEVTGINGVDEQRGRVFYTSSEPGHLERQLYSVGLDGSDKRRITAEPGSHTVTMGPAAAYYLDDFSSMKQPGAVTLHSGDGKQISVYRGADERLSSYDILPTEIVPFRASDGTDLYGRLIRPAGFRPGTRYPVIVKVYGGPGSQAFRDSWTGIDIDQAYAQMGYAVWEAENRGGTGRGHAFETPVFHNLGKVELSDQIDGVKQLIAMGIADPARVGIQGWSYGGFMTANAMLNAGEVFKCGIAGAPVTDWRNYDSIYTERYMGLPQDNPEGYRESALPSLAHQLSGRLMLVHNIEDDNVLFQNTLQLSDALQKAGKIFETMIYPQKTHAVTGPVARQMNESMVEFFDRCLK